ncbi:MAG TPA: CBS domain-containing protein [Thermoanaerobaculia bacterium]|jgi:CBS domain-containing protein|nr:CBS domain-containing protein [Thermoanaerobaculia bacterium]
MLCPYCKHENLEGADQCESCLMDLQPLGLPEAETALEDRLMNEGVAKLGAKRAIMVGPRTSIRDAVETMVKNEIGCVLVHDGERVVGILSERDLLLRVGLRLVSIENQPVSTVMTHRPLTLDCDAPLAFALNYMTLHDFRHLPLTRNGELEGIISLRDFLALLFRTYPEIAQSKGVEQ